MAIPAVPSRVATASPSMPCATANLSPSSTAPTASPSLLSLLMLTLGLDFLVSFFSEDGERIEEGSVEAEGRRGGEARGRDLEAEAAPDVADRSREVGEDMFIIAAATVRTLEELDPAFAAVALADVAEEEEADEGVLPGPAFLPLLGV